MRALGREEGVAEVEEDRGVRVDRYLVLLRLCDLVESRQREQPPLIPEHAGVIGDACSVCLRFANQHPGDEAEDKHGDAAIGWKRARAAVRPQWSTGHLLNIIKSEAASQDWECIVTVEDVLDRMVGGGGWCVGIQQSMNRQYEQVFRTKGVSHHEVKGRILGQLAGHDPRQRCNYDEMLYLLDQHIHERCDRDVLQQIFSQAEGADHLASLQDVVEKYLENVETSRVCIVRDEFRVREAGRREEAVRDRSKSFIFLRLVQASIYTRFTREPTFQYRIQPTELPPVTLVNALNPLLNHEYTLEMEEPSFDIVFLQSGIEILRWSFPDQPMLPEGEYTRSVKSENVSFELKIKYMPKDQTKAKQQIRQELEQLQQHLAAETDAFHRLCSFKPFLEQREAPVGAQAVERGGWFDFTESLFGCMPFLRQHVRTLFYLLVVTILLECLASSFWAIEFLDIIACFYGLSLLLEPSTRDCSLRLLTLQLTFLVLIIKSIWGAVEQPFFAKSGANKALLVVCVAAKLILILALAVTLIRKHEIDALKSELLEDEAGRGDKRISDSLDD